MKNNRFIKLDFKKASLSVYEGKELIAVFVTDKPIVITPEQIEEIRVAVYKELA